MDLWHLAPHARHSGRQHPRLPRLYLRHPDPPPAVRGAPMIANTFAVFFTALVQLLLLLTVAPLVGGLIKTLKARLQIRRGPGILDRKSTLHNYSHLVISYAVFCLK